MDNADFLEKEMTLIYSNIFYKEYFDWVSYKILNIYKLRNFQLSHLKIFETITTTKLPL